MFEMRAGGKFLSYVMHIFTDCGPMNNAGLTLFTYEKTVLN
jgi:hypothetical protein